MRIESHSGEWGEKKRTGPDASSRERERVCAGNNNRLPPYHQCPDALRVYIKSHLFDDRVPIFSPDFFVLLPPRDEADGIQRIDKPPLLL